MSRNEIRVNKTREDRAVNDFVERLIGTGGFNVIFPTPDQLFHGLQQLIQEDVEEGEEAREGLGLESEFISDFDKSTYVEQLTQCVCQHFQTHRADKFRVALTELIHESLGFAWSIHRERSGFDKEEVNEARPTLADLQQNVLRHSLRRIRGLPVRKERETEYAENDSNIPPFTRAIYEIQNNISLWTYDHVHVYELIREHLRNAYINRYPDAEIADDLSHGIANEMAELIWENIDEAVGLMVKILIVIVNSVAWPSIAQQNAITAPEIENEKRSAGKLKEEIIIYMIDEWLKKFLPLLRTAGGSRPVIDISDDDCKEYVRRYEELLPILQEASTVYKEITADAGIVDYDKDEALLEVRRRYSSELEEEFIQQIPYSFPSKIALSAAARGSKMQGYGKRKLEEFRSRGRDLLRKES